MNISVDVQVASEGDDNPDPESISSWLNSVLSFPAVNFKPLSSTENSQDDVEVCVRIVDENESQTLNNQYRQKNSPTNVLSFPADLPEGIPIEHLGDIVICNSVVRKEANEQGKETRAHWAHMIVHGTLHLLGYDHIEDSEAEIMEALETKIMTHLLFPPPYQHLSKQQSQ